MEAALCHSVSHSVTSVLTSFLASLDCNESLAWFEAPGFLYTISTGSLPGLFSDILLLPCVREVLHLWICRTSPVLDEVAVWVGQLQHGCGW